MGPAGIGKTEIVNQAAQELGLAFLSYSITHHTRQSAIGLPRLIEGTINGRTVSMTEYTMSEIIAQVYATMEATGKTEGILFLDEYNCVSESMRPIMLQLLQDKSFGPHRIPDGWMLVLAGNPPEYNRAAMDIDPVTADRMRMVYIKPDYAAWNAYARKRNIHPVILSYLDNHKNHFYVYMTQDEGTALVTARGWEDLSIMMRYLEENGEHPDLALIAQYLQAGETARSFYQYCMQYAAIIKSGILEQIFTRSPATLITLKDMSFERAWSVVSALLSRLQTMAHEAVSLDDTTAAVYNQLQIALQADHPDEALINGLGAIEDRPAREFVNQCIMLVAKKGGLEKAKERFRTSIRQQRMDAYQKTAVAIDNTIAVCRRALAGKPHLEFLFGRLCDNPDIIRVVSGSNIPEFRQLYNDTVFHAGNFMQELNQAITEEYLLETV